MAEALLRDLGTGQFEASSAGVSPADIHPLTRQVMAEAGMDISSHSSKAVDQVPMDKITHVITVCDYAQATCPTIPNKTGYKLGYMAAPSRKTKKIRKRKHRKAGKDRKRKLRIHGSTQSLDKLLGPLDR